MSPGLQEIREAATRIAGQVHRTPVLTSRSLDRLSGMQLFFKCENLQRVGAFKFRGASNAVALLDQEQARRGVVTHSSGNHAQALALAARLRGVDAHVVMPRDAPDVKKAAVRGYGARIIECEPTLQAREAAALRVMEQTGATFVHPYDDARVIAGQGTTALELLAQVPLLDALIAPIGGGGLLSGCAIAGHALRPRLRVLGAEPSSADDARRSLLQGSLITRHEPDTICDGLLTTLCERTLGILGQHVDEVLCADDDAVRHAMRLLLERMKLVVEPSAVIGLAALLVETPPALLGKRVGVVLSGGNVELGLITSLVEQDVADLAT